MKVKLLYIQFAGYMQINECVKGNFIALNTYFIK